MIGFLYSPKQPKRTTLSPCEYCGGMLIVSLAGAVTCADCHRHDEDLENQEDE